MSARARRAGRRTHLSRVVRSRVDGVGAQMGIGHFVHVNLVEHDADSHAGSALVVVDEDEFSSFGFGHVAE